MVNEKKRTWAEIYKSKSPSTQAVMRALENKMVATAIFSNEAVRKAYDRATDKDAMANYAIALIRRDETAADAVYSASFDKASLDTFTELFRTALAMEGGFELPPPDTGTNR